LAIDHEDRDRPVALKLMKLRENFDREIASRKDGKFSEDFIVGILRDHDADIDESYRDEVVQKGFELGRYCIVMDAGERNLSDIMEKERIAGVNWELIRVIAQQVIQAVGHMHDNGFIHGDLKRTSHIY
jgi:serine/threonine protein kinase